MTLVVTGRGVIAGARDGSIAWRAAFWKEHYPADSAEVDRYLRFRGQLRASQADRELYEQVKRKLASQNWAYTQQYADAKTEVVEQILARSTGRT